MKATSVVDRTTVDPMHRTILGVRFFNGNASQAISQIKQGGLVLAPSGPGLKTLPYDAQYRESMLGADLILTDSGLMVRLWNVLERDSLRRLSGLEYLRVLLHEPDVRRHHGAFWVMPNEASAKKNVTWMNRQGIETDDADIYLAPFYGETIEDPILLQILNKRRPQHIFVTVGSGKQEVLGYYLKRNLRYRPAIHCIGAAIAFLSGDQAHIPEWADRNGLGWLIRCLWKPKQYLPRYWEARKLVMLMLTERHHLPIQPNSEGRRAQFRFKR